LDIKNMEKIGTSSSTRDVQGQPVAKKSRLLCKTIIYDESIANQWLDEPPLEIWDHHIIPLLSLRDLALSRPVCTFFEAYWQEKFQGNVIPLRVGNDVATINDVMGVIAKLSRRREYTKASPFVVLLAKGNHEVTTSHEYYHYRNRKIAPTTLCVTHNNITFIGQGIGVTTILGGFGIHDVQNITLKQMTITNTSEHGSGISMYSAEIELVDVLTTRCSGVGIFAGNVAGSSSSKLVATRCEMSNNGSAGLSIAPYTHINIFQNVCLKNCIIHHNSGKGIYVAGKVIINVHGNATAIHSNGKYGIDALYGAKIFLHLPSHHNTLYNNNNGYADMYTRNGGTITNVVD
jgi:hypothetical protein